MDWDVMRALAGGRVVSRREYPGLAGRLSRLCRNGELTAVLPGVYAPSHLAADWRTRAEAACLYDPTAVIVGEAAAALSFWPDLQPDRVEVAGRRSVLARPGFRFTARSVPRELVWNRVATRVTMPALTALDLVERHGGDGIDRALRSRSATVTDLREALALTPMRRGNQARRALVLDSRAGPWSRAERLAHRLFREAGILGWRANVRFPCGGEVYFLDIAFLDQALVVEVDGREFHGDAGAFENDRRRGNHLLLAGLRVLHVTWRMLTDEPELVVSTVRRALAMGRGGEGSAPRGDLARRDLRRSRS